MTTMAIFDAFLKRKYVKRWERLVYAENVLLGLLEKKGDTGMEGDALSVPIHYAKPQGQSADFETAQNVASGVNGGNNKQTKFVITAGDYFGVVEIGDKVMEASRTNSGAFLTAKSHEIDNLIDQAGENLSLYTWGNGGNSLGEIATLPGSDVITFTNPQDVSNFEVGMQLVWSLDDGSATTHVLKAGTTWVTNVDREAGTITVDDATTGAGMATGDCLFRAGDFYGNTNKIIVKGVQAFITPNATAPGDLWGVTNAVRLTDVQRFTGCRLPSSEYSAKPIEDRIRTLASFCTSRYKAKRFDAGFLNPEDWTRFETGMMSQGYRALTDDKTQFGYSAIELNVAGGKVKIYADRHCPKGHFFGLRMDNFWMSSMGKLISPVNGDGLTMLRKVNSMSYEFRIKSYPLFVCNAPLHGSRVPV
jgi:hypothetical protein